MGTQYRSIDEYIKSFPPEVQSRLEQMRQAIKETAPGAEDTISYQMPAFRQNGILVYFAAFKNTSDFTPKRQELPHLKKNWHLISHPKGQYSFPSINPYHSTWSRGLCLSG